MEFSTRVLNWFDHHGRKDLPWQQSTDSYRIWVSEIMLQQTQVATVIPYYTHFMQRFPNVAALANATLDEVLSHWSGLGYYARARNLHKAARVIRDEYQGQFPTHFNEVVSLAGIGRSTAGAILAFSEEQRWPILDGNVKRVLSRYLAVEGWTGQVAVSERLWQSAENFTPHQRIREYTQAIMDLGATVCKRSNPLCSSCPLQNNCLAFAQNRVKEFPTPKPRKSVPTRKTVMLMLLNEFDEVLLQRRPPTGIWGGLLSFPEFSAKAEISGDVETIIGPIHILEQWPTMRHRFSHFQLEIQPLRASLVQWRPQVADDEQWVWSPLNTQKGGFSAPVKILLQQLQQHLIAGEKNNGSNGTV